eukprot:m51a1_g1946 hypothetical protein (575) ;mRNA; f:955242-957490
MEQQQPASRRSSAGVKVALCLSVAAVLIAAAPVALLVARSADLVDHLGAAARRNAAAPVVTSSGVRVSDLPSKWAAKYLLPQYFQEDRGTCWDFATIGWLEQSYRQNGVEKGFLEPQQYVRFSEQAFGISMIEACRGHRDVCDVLGDLVWQNGTSGGEIWWLYSLTSLYDKVLPASVCPYTDEAHEHECPGMAQALAANPIKFDIASMQTAYNVLDSKALMIAHDRPLVWTSLVHDVIYYMPCADQPWASKPECSEAKRVRCPTDRYYNSEYCARYVAAMYNQDGEFMMHGNTVIAGGHGMNAVGYNDEFVTKQGQKGGFIIKNSWHDQTYGSDPSGRGGRGSHSVAYWMQTISAWDEKALCPGPLNPDNWLSCVSQEAGPTMRRQRRSTTTTSLADTDIRRTCLDAEFMQYLVNNTLQPTEFQCLSADWCSTSADYRWFLASSERNVEQDLLQVCMLRYDSRTAEQALVCTPYVNPTLVAYMWAPVAAQQQALRNDPDFCGYYFWPYEVADRQVGMAGGFFTTYFDVAWSDMSYAKNAARYPQADYSLVRSSTFTQRQADFGPVPSPFAKTRY